MARLRDGVHRGGFIDEKVKRAYASPLFTQAQMDFHLRLIIIRESFSMLNNASLPVALEKPAL